MSTLQTTRRPIVLIVNDDQSLLDMLAALLRREDYNVVTAKDGASALEIALSNEPDIIISDVVMPVMDGLEFCRRLKQDARTANVPVLLASGVLTAAENSLEGIVAGADDYIEMPFHQPELLVKVARLTERHRVERLYRELVEQAADIISSSDMQGIITGINETGKRFFGRNASELIGQHISALIGEDAAAADLAKLRNHTSGEPLRSVYNLQDARGEWHHLENVLTLVRDAQGRATGVRAVMRDITERVRAEQALQESEQHYRVLFESNPQPMWVYDPDTLGFLAVNNAAVNHYGYSRAEFLQMTIKDIRSIDEIPALLENIRRTGKGLSFSGRHKHRQKDGTIIDVEITSHEIVFAGKSARLVLANDITERIGAEQRLLASVQQMKTLTALATSVKDRSETDKLLVGLADSITDSTDYRVCLVSLFTSKPLFHMRLLSHSSNVPAQFVERMATAPYTLARLRSLIEEGARIEVGELGFAAYYPSGHHSADFPSLYNFDAEESLNRDASRWRKGDQLFVPLVTREGDYIGFISLEDPRSGRAPDHGSVLPVVALARQIVQLLAQQQTAEALEQQAEREALINRISRAVRHSFDINEIFRTAVAELGAHLNVDRCLLLMLDREDGIVRQMAEYFAPDVRSIGRDYNAMAVADLITGVRQHGVLVFDDVSTDERIREIYNKFLRAGGVRSIMYAAIRVGDETPAVFALSTTRKLRQWRESDVALARAVADQTGIAIRQAELYQKAESTSAREALINRLSLSIRASLRLPEVLRTATHELGRALKASRVHVRLYDATRSTAPIEHDYIAEGTPGIKHFGPTYNDPIGQRLLRQLQPIIINDALHYTQGTKELSAHIRAQAAALGLRSSIYFPLAVDGHFRGALYIHQTDRARHWHEDEIALVESVAAQLVNGVGQAELFEMAGRARKEWETTFNAMSDGIYIFDKNGILARVNRAGAALEDTWPHLLMGRHCCDILRVNGDDRNCVVEKAIAKNRSITIEVSPERINRPLLVTAEPLISDENKIVGAVCTARDISELRKIEAFARERQTLLTNILESARESIFALDTHGYFQWCNAASAALSNYRPEELVGHHYRDVVLPADLEIFKEGFESALRGEPQACEIRHSGPAGDLYYSLIDQAPLIVDGRTTGVLGIARDITQQKLERERAAQADKLRALGQLASGVAHDFNNALAAILGRVQLSRRRVEDQALIQNLDIIQTAAEDAAATVRRIQTFARQSIAEEFELLAVNALLRDAVEITRTHWENEARARGLQYDVMLDADCELYTSGNASELREVFVNLIVNAVYAMPEGGRLAIDCARQDERVRLRFADTGTGMTEEVRARIFEPFYTTKGMQGTGLGLAVSYGIIERHHGHINVESTPGRGTTFEIDLPAAEPHERSLQTNEARREVTSTLSVLIIDDEDFVRETLSEMLKVLSHKVVLAESGREAFERMAAHSFDLVFTDLSMPEMDGWEVAREIRRRSPDTSIILVTGYGKGTAPPSGEANLVDSVIGKPFDFSQIEQTIAKVMDKAVEAKE